MAGPVAAATATAAAAAATAPAVTTLTDPAGILVFLFSGGVTLGSIAGGIGMFVWRLPRNERFARRLGAFAGVGLLVLAVIWCTLPALDPALTPAGFPYGVQLVFYSAILVAATWATTWLYDASLWTALFCCSAGYAVQNFASGATEAVCVLAGITGTAAATTQGILAHALINLACATVVYLAFWLLLGRRISREGIERIQDRSLLVIMAVVILGVIGFDLLIKSLTESGLGTGPVLALRCFHGLTCALTFFLEYELLVSRHLRAEREATERVLAERERQYERSRESIEAINIKCHDIRHQIRSLAGTGAAVDRAVLDDIAREIDVYDSAVQTGNEALDTILTEKRLMCAREHIALSCIADGAALSFMSAADIYAFFGNALDNAIEATRQLDSPERRSISLVVRSVAGVVSIHVENPFDGTLLRDENGAIATSKGDRANHGFGLLSMRRTIERYGGTLATLAQDGVFHVNAMLPPTA